MKLATQSWFSKLIATQTSDDVTHQLATKNDGASADVDKVFSTVIWDHPQSERKRRKLQDIVELESGLDAAIQMHIASDLLPAVQQENGVLYSLFHVSDESRMCVRCVTTVSNKNHISITKCSEGQDLLCDHCKP